jgi:aspartate/glutamate racemase
LTQILLILKRWDSIENVYHFWLLWLATISFYQKIWQKFTKNSKSKSSNLIIFIFLYLFNEFHISSHKTDFSSLSDTLETPKTKLRS